MVDCNSTSGEGGTHHLVQLEWHHSTLIEENHPLDRIFLFSHCINPTNTSLVREREIRLVIALVCHSKHCSIIYSLHTFIGVKLVLVLKIAIPSDVYKM